MELTYIIIAATIVLLLPIVLTRLLSARARDPGKAHGMRPSRNDASSGLKAGELAGVALAARKTAERRAKDGGSDVLAAEKTERTQVDAKAPVRDAGLVATIRHAQETTQEVQKLVAKGRKAEAIKILREKSGLGLREAKDLVDRLG